MPTARETFDRSNDLITRSVDRFNDGVESTQSGMYKRVISEIRKFELDASGNIKPTSKNIKLLRKLRNDLRGLLINKTYLKKVDSYLNTFDQLKGINDGYFKVAASTFTPNKNVYKELQRASIEVTKNSLLSSGIDRFVIEPVDRILTQNVTSGGTFDDLAEALRTEIVGDAERLGRYERYTKQITTDALNQFNSNYNQSIGVDLGFEFYQYQGGIKDTTRSYCRERAWKYFHIKEIENEIPATWDGKIPETNSSNILTYRGGYNCRHQYRPVGESLVPQTVKNRAESKGYYKPQDN